MQMFEQIYLLRAVKIDNELYSISFQKNLRFINNVTKNLAQSETIGFKFEKCPTKFLYW